MKTKPLEPLAERCIANGRSNSDIIVKVISETFDALEGEDFEYLSDTERRLLLDVSLVVARENLNDKRERAAAVLDELLATYGAEALMPDLLAKTQAARAARAS